MPTCPRRRRLAGVPVVLALLLAACGGGGPATGPADGGAAGSRTLRISAIPDQDPARLVEINRAMARYLETALGVRVEYVPVSDYAAAVSLFRTGDVDMVFFGGLTGVQARLRAPGSTLLAQRDVDDAFRSVFIASSRAGIGPVPDVAGLAAFKGRRFTFGSESSTSGRLMPEFFLDQAGLDTARDFGGPPGYSGSHDKTIDLVAAGTYEGGALNAQVWKRRRDAGTVDPAKVVEVFTTPPYRDYHWIAGPRTDERFGSGFTGRLADALLALDYSNPEHAAVLDLYSAKGFIPTRAENYREIEHIGRKLRLIT